ncbi:hypothetical protein CDEF62S_00593 [Castellaniella defragrans]
MRRGYLAGRLDEGDLAAVHGDICAGSHGNAHISPRKRWCVIDAAARHGNDVALSLQLLHQSQLVSRLDFAVYLIDPQLASNGLSRG